MYNIIQVVTKIIGFYNFDGICYLLKKPNMN